MADTTAPLVAPFVGRKGDRVPNGTPRVTVYNVETGEALEVKPISAREGIARGVWSREPVTVPEAEAAPEATVVDEVTETTSEAKAPKPTRKRKG